MIPESRSRAVSRTQSRESRVRPIPTPGHELLLCRLTTLLLGRTRAAMASETTETLFVAHRSNRDIFADY